MFYKVIETANDLREEFKKYDRDQFTYAGYEMLLEIFEQYEEKTELDVIAICCDYTEMTFEEVLSEYKNIFEDEEVIDTIDRDGIADVLGQYTQVYELVNGNFIVQEF